MRLLLTRHAQTASNVGHALDTAYPGAPLTELGREQAARLAARLAGEPLAVVAASDLLRVPWTAAPDAAAHGLPVVTLDGLREIGAGGWEMQNSAEAIEGYVGVVRSWAAGDLDAAVPGGPSGHEFLARFDAAVLAVEDAASTEDGSQAVAVAVSHGAAIRTWAAIRCGNASAEEVAGRRLANTDILVVEGSTGSGWLLDGWLEDPADQGASLTAEH
jgi:broad specificity phosphatase PhoE